MGKDKNKGTNRRAVPVQTPQKTIAKTVVHDNNSSDESDTNKHGPNVNKPNSHPSKRGRIVTENDMDEIFAEPLSEPLNPAAPAFAPLKAPPGGNAVNPQKTFAAPPVTPITVTPTPDNQSNSVPPLGSSSTTISGSNAGASSTTPTPNDHHNISIHDSTNKKQPDDQPEIMNTDDNTASSDDVTKLQASTPLNNIIREKETRKAAVNRIKFYLTSKYPLSFK